MLDRTSSGGSSPDRHRSERSLAQPVAALVWTRMGKCLMQQQQVAAFGGFTGAVL